MVKDAKPSHDDGDDGELLTPSPLDPQTHAEMQLLYRESTETLRFVKAHQWKTVGATLLTYLGIVFIAGFVDAGPSLTQKFMGISIILCCAVIFTLIIYQFWMHNEITKIDRMETYLSSYFAQIRAMKSRREGNLHRYLLLSFMSVVVILGAVVVFLALSKIAL